MKRYIIVVTMDDLRQYANVLEVTEGGTRELYKVASEDWYNNEALNLAKERLVELRGLVPFDIVSI